MVDVLYHIVESACKKNIIFYFAIRLNILNILPVNPVELLKGSHMRQTFVLNIKNKIRENVKKRTIAIYKSFFKKIINFKYFSLIRIRRMQGDYGESY